MNRGRREPRPGRTALLLVALFALSGCAAPVGQSPVAASAPVVLPSGSGPVTTAPSAATSTRECTASWPPLSPLPAPGSMPPGYLRTLQNRGFLRVGVDQNTYQWGYRDSTGMLRGFDIDMLRQVAIAMFGKATDATLHFVVVPNADRISAVNSGLVDIVAETMTITCARWQQVDFSSVYYEAGQRVLVPAGSPIASVPADLAGRRVCAVAGSTSLDALARLQVSPPVVRWQARNQTDCLVLLQQGQVDAISTDDTILRGMAAQDPALHLVPGRAFTSEPYGMAINATHRDLTRFVNGVLERVRRGMWATIYRTSIGPSPPPPPPATYRALPSTP